jgi:hypothetical protein
MVVGARVTTNEETLKGPMTEVRVAGGMDEKETRVLVEDNRHRHQQRPLPPFRFRVAAMATTTGSREEAGRTTTITTIPINLHPLFILTIGHWKIV